MTRPDSSVPTPRDPERESASGLAAVLFDMDGTLVDSEALWADAESEVVAELGGVWTEEDHRRNVGGSMDAVVGYILGLAETATDPEAVETRLRAAFARRVAEGPHPRPGAVELVTEVASSPVLAALVTSTERALVEPSLSRLGAHHFDVIVAGDEVTRMKPDPEPYLTAARMLGVDPTRCVALEDSLPGVASARAAGCVTVAVPNMVALAAAPGQVVVDSLLGVDLEWLRRLAAANGDGDRGH